MIPDTTSIADRARSRKASLRDIPAHTLAGASQPTTFFLRRKRDIETGPRGDHRDLSPDSAPDNSSTASIQTMSDSSYGVQSLEEALEGAFPSAPRATSSELNTSITTDTSSEPRRTPSPEPTSIAGKKRKAGNPIHPKIAAAAQRIISSERPSSRALPDSPSFRSGASSSPFREQLRRVSPSPSSTPLSPLRLSPRPDSALSGTPRSASPRSLRLSDEECSVLDDTGSQAVQSSSGEEEDEETMQDNSHTLAGAPESSQGPQLRMPSITMPARRPFTERGRRMGRLKVLVAGPAGIGKTSLIKSIVQTCEDIVHVDPSSPTLQHTWSQYGRRTGDQKESGKTYIATTKIAEVHASTKAYPSWWSEMDESRTLRRRKSMGDVVLERNLCFVDTPGWVQSDDTNGIHDHSNHLTAYVEALLRQNSSMAAMSDAELLNLLGGGGGQQVDAVLYMFDPVSKELSNQIDLLRRLGEFTNIVPLIGHADTVSKEEMEEFRSTLSSCLRNSNTNSFTFNITADDSDTHNTAVQPIAPFAISSAPGDDAEVMEASLLMSSGYIRPLISSDLPTLIQHLLDPEHMQWLRHCAVKKFLSWRRLQLANSLDIQAQAVYDSPQHAAASSAFAANSSMGPSVAASTISSPSQVLVPHPGSSFYRSDSPSPSNMSSNSPQHGLDLALQQYATRAHTDRYTEVRLAKWAEDLQKSLENERRQQHQRMHGRGRAEWSSLYESSKNKEAEDLALVRQDERKSRSVEWQPLFGSSALDPRDPLGVLAFGQRFRRNGWITLQVLGGCGIIGAVAMWTVRNWESVAEFLGMSTPDVEMPGFPHLGPSSNGGSDTLLRAWGLDFDWKGFFWGGGSGSW